MVQDKNTQQKNTLDYIFSVFTDYGLVSKEEYEVWKGEKELSNFISCNDRSKKSMKISQTPKKERLLLRIKSCF